MPELADSFECELTAAENLKTFRGSNVEYVLQKTFLEQKEAELEIDTEKCWGKRNTFETSDGTKIIYRCNLVKARRQQCSASAYMLLAATGETQIFKSVNKHNCDSIDTKAGTAMTEGVKAIITELFRERKKPKAVMNHLIAIGQNPLPKRYQVVNYIAKLKHLEFGPTVISLGELKCMLEERTGVPDCKETAFVVNYEISEDKEIFRFFIS